jgi:thiol-disulfide isomerase/thioredoxin
MRKPIHLALLAVIFLMVTTNFSGCHSNPASSGTTGQVVKADDNGRKSAAPDVTFKDLDGKDVSLASLKGKVVVVNFWATWCDPCREEIPWLIEYQQKYADKGFTILGVAMDEEGKPTVQPFVETTPFNVNGHPTTMNYPIVLGNDELADKFGGLLGMPTSFVISRDGKIAKKYIGLVNREALAKDIEGLLGTGTAQGAAGNG